MESDLRPPTMLRSQKSVGGLYAIGYASFIPFLGVLFGVISVIIGVARRAWTVVALGAAGILFSAVIFLGLSQSGGIFGKLRAGLALVVLNSAVKDIESFKQAHGRYPASLSEVEPNDKTRLDNCIDPVTTKHNAALNGRFYYRLDASGTCYFLRSVGPDGIPFTGDDIVPALSEGEIRNTGLRLQQ